MPPLGGRKPYPADPDIVYRDPHTARWHLAAGSRILVGDIPDRQEVHMTGIDALQSVQFVTVQGKRLAVLQAEDWESLIEWLETLEDWAVAKEAMAALQAAAGDRQAVGWVKWSDVADELV
jgi:hypothetical protein